MKTKKFLLLTVIIALVGGAIFLFSQPKRSSVELARDPKDAAYLVEGNNVKLSKGQNSQPIPNSAGTIQTRIFGEPTYGDINKDGRDEAVLLIVRSGGGSGTFFYVVAAVKIDNGWLGTNAILLGDRIAPQNINILNGEANVNFAIRKPSEPFSVSPSVGITKRFIVDNSNLVEVK